MRCFFHDEAVREVRETGDFSCVIQQTNEPLRGNSMSWDRRKVMRALANQGVTVVREGKAHTIIQSKSGGQTSVPRHDQIDRGTARGIARQLGLDLKQFDKDVR